MSRGRATAYTIGYGLALPADGSSTELMMENLIGNAVSQIEMVKDVRFLPPELENGRYRCQLVVQLHGQHTIAAHFPKVETAMKMAVANGPPRVAIIIEQLGDGGKSNLLTADQYKEIATTNFTPLMTAGRAMAMVEAAREISRVDDWEGYMSYLCYNQRGNSIKLDLPVPPEELSERIKVAVEVIGVTKRAAVVPYLVNSGHGEYNLAGELTIIPAKFNTQCFCIYMETVTTPTVTGMNAAGDSILSALPSFPGWELSLSKKSMTLVTSLGVRYPWPLVCNKIVPVGVFGNPNASNVKLLEWMQKAVAPSLALTLINEERGLTVPQSSTQIIQRARAAVRGSDGSMNAVIASLQDLKLRDVTQSVEQLTQGIEFEENKLDELRQRRAEIDAEVAEQLESIKRQQERTADLDAMWNWHYAVNKEKWDRMDPTSRVVEMRAELEALHEAHSDEIHVLVESIDKLGEQERKIELMNYIVEKAAEYDYVVTYKPVTQPLRTVQSDDIPAIGSSMSQLCEIKMVKYIVKKAAEYGFAVTCTKKE